MRTVVLEQLSPEERRSLLRRSAVPDQDVRSKATDICRDVMDRGAEGVEDYARAFGGGFGRVTVAAIEEAIDSLPQELRTALDLAMSAIETFHLAQGPNTTSVTTTPGVEITRRWTPLRRVGAYVPGGSAPLPSTALMTITPARLAGVAEIVAVSPATDSGQASPLVVAAAALAGATEIWTIGGAQAIAALAYGAGELQRVQKIVGPGNSWVTAAKLAVFGDVAIDLPAGPSEVLVLADATANPRLVAVDLLCQAEHGPDSPAVLVTTDAGIPDLVLAEIERLLPSLERSSILRRTLNTNGLAVITSSHDSAVLFAQEYAAEHVSIATAFPDADAARITSAGSVYIGPWAAESAGDYATGANHVLPTGGLAGACNPLQIEDYGSWRQEQRLTRRGLEALTPTITTLARAEGLTAHALAATIRFETEGRLEESEGRGR
ncbi:MAG TPA: histidinol dehydrogenase [Acidimicrobiia bacterium]|nr:histidinol dehydrogenase [Acidimicrobiia bacterium]